MAGPHTEQYLTGRGRAGDPALCAELVDVDSLVARERVGRWDGHLQFGLGEELDGHLGTLSVERSARRGLGDHGEVEGAGPQRPNEGTPQICKSERDRSRTGC
jgi:hypothetical protein